MDHSNTRPNMDLFLSTSVGGASWVQLARSDALRVDKETASVINKKATKKTIKNSIPPKRYASIGQLTKARDQGHAKGLVVEIDHDADEGFIVRDRSGSIRLQMTIPAALKALCADRGLRKIIVDGALQ